MNTPFHTMTLTQFLDALGSDRPTPGGGGAAAFLAAQACALAEMSARLTVSNKKCADFKEKAEEYTHVFPLARSIFLDLMDEDAKNFASLMTAYKEPAGEKKKETLQEAYKLAAQAPIQTAQTMSDLLPAITDLLLHGNPNVVSDTIMAAQFAIESIRAAILNIKMNTKYIEDPFFNHEQEEAEKHWEETISAIDAVLTYQVHL